MHGNANIYNEQTMANNAFNANNPFNTNNAPPINNAASWAIQMNGPMQGMPMNAQPPDAPIFSTGISPTGAAIATITTLSGRCNPTVDFRNRNPIHKCNLIVDFRNRSRTHRCGPIAVFHHRRITHHRITRRSKGSFLPNPMVASTHRIGETAISRSCCITLPLLR